MAKSDSERGPFGAWLVQERKKREGSGRDGRMTAAEVRAWLIRDRGFGIGESAYAELEAGTALPSAEQRTHLAALFDSVPPSLSASTGGDVAQLLEVVRLQQEQVASLGRQVADLLSAVRALAGVRPLSEPERDELTEAALDADTLAQHDWGQEGATDPPASPPPPSGRRGPAARTKR